MARQLTIVNGNNQTLAATTCCPTTVNLASQNVSSVTVAFDAQGNITLTLS